MSETEILQIRDALTKVDAEHSVARAAADKVREDMRESGVDFSKDADAFARVDEAYKAADAKRDEAADLRVRQSRLLEILGQRAVETKPTIERTEARTFAQRLMASAEYRHLADAGVLRNGGAKVNMDPVEIATRDELRDGLRRRTTVDNTSGSGGGLIWSDRLEDMLVAKPVRSLSLSDVITVGATDSDTIEWVKETTVTDAVTPTAYGTAAPESAYGYTRQTTTVHRLPHFVPITKGALADGGQLGTLLESRLTRGVRLKVESQALSGDNTGENFEGIATVAGTLTQARSTDTRSDAVHKAITKVRINLFSDPFAIGLHPTDYENLLLEKDANGNYTNGRPAAESALATIWGLHPVISTLFTAGTPWVADFSEAYLWVRSGIEVSISDSHSTFFTQGLIAILAEMRAAFKVVQPLAFCSVTAF